MGSSQSTSDQQQNDQQQHNSNSTYGALRSQIRQKQNLQQQPKSSDNKKREPLERNHQETLVDKIHNKRYQIERQPRNQEKDFVETVDPYEFVAPRHNQNQKRKNNSNSDDEDEDEDEKDDAEGPVNNKNSRQKKNSTSTKTGFDKGHPSQNNLISHSSTNSEQHHQSNNINPLTAEIYHLNPINFDQHQVPVDGNRPPPPTREADTIISQQTSQPQQQQQQQTTTITAKPRLAPPIVLSSTETPRYGINQHFFDLLHRFAATPKHGKNRNVGVESSSSPFLLFEESKGCNHLLETSVRRCGIRNVSRQQRIEDREGAAMLSVTKQNQRREKPFLSVFLKQFDDDDEKDTKKMLEDEQTTSMFSFIPKLDNKTVFCSKCPQCGQCIQHCSFCFASNNKPHFGNKIQSSSSTFCHLETTPQFIENVRKNLSFSANSSADQQSPISVSLSEIHGCLLQLVFELGLDHPLLFSAKRKTHDGEEEEEQEQEQENDEMDSFQRANRIVAKFLEACGIAASVLRSLACLDWAIDSSQSFSITASQIRFNFADQEISHSPGSFETSAAASSPSSGTIILPAASSSKPTADFFNDESFLISTRGKSFINISGPSICFEGEEEESEDSSLISVLEILFPDFEQQRQDEENRFGWSSLLRRFQIENSKNDSYLFVGDPTCRPAFLELKSQIASSMCFCLIQSLLIHRSAGYLITAC